MTKIFIVIFIGLIYGTSSAQCVGKDSLRDQLIYLRSASFPDSQKLAVLLKYAENVKSCAPDSTHCSLLIDIGQLYHKKAEYLKAIPYYKQAIGFVYANGNGGSVRPAELIKYYNLLFDSYDSLNNTSQKIRALDSAIAVGIRLKSVTRLCLWSLYYKIQYFFNVGDYYRCIETAVACERLGKEYATSPSEKDFPGGLIYASVSLHWNVNALLALNKYDDAERLLLEKISEYQRTKEKIRLGTLYEQLGEVYAFERQYRKALFYFQEAFKKERANAEIRNRSARHLPAIQLTHCYKCYTSFKR